MDGPFAVSLELPRGRRRRVDAELFHVHLDIPVHDRRADPVIRQFPEHLRLVGADQVRRRDTL